VTRKDLSEGSKEGFMKVLARVPEMNGTDRARKIRAMLDATPAADDTEIALSLSYLNVSPDEVRRARAAP
jgi:hypothetical protein